jgi:hypothetical protein
MTKKIPTPVPASPVDSGVAVDGTREFIVVMRGSSAGVFPEHSDPALNIERYPTPSGPVTMRYRTRYPDRGDGVKVPGQMWVEIRGRGTRLDQFTDAAANAGNSLLSHIAIAGNTSIKSPAVELSYDCGPGDRDREYFQVYLPPEGNQPSQARLLNPSHVMDVIKAISAAPEAARIRRACEQYRLALDHWHRGNEILVMSHLWMAAEALTKAIERRLCEERGVVGREAIAASLGIGVRDLDPYIRREGICRGDVATYEAMKRASDEFEHGFGEFDAIRERAGPVIVAFGHNLRRSIFEEIQLAPDVMADLLEGESKKPMTDRPVVQHLTGTLTGPENGLAKEGSPYPFIKWSARPVHPPEGSPPEQRFSNQATFSPEVGPAAKFTFRTLTVWPP